MHSEQVTAGFLLEEETIQDQHRQIQELQQQPRQRGGHDQRQEEMEVSGIAASRGRIKLKWIDGGKAPRKMIGEVATVDGRVAYFLPEDLMSRFTFAYNSATNKWSELPKCPNYGFSLAVVNRLLTAIGGGKTPTNEVTNSLLSLTDNKWTERFPPMPTKRQLTTAVCSGKSLVVAGGEGGGENKLSIVEVMNTETLQWSTASSLPHSLYQASATVCGDQIYMLGGLDRNAEPAKSVFTCSLAALLQSCQPQWMSSEPIVWHQLVDVPVTSSTCTSLQGQLLAVGGDYSNDKTTDAVHMYNPTTNSWEVISYMNTRRSRCLVAVLPHDELMVVGGDIPSGWGTDTVEFASIV